METATRKSNLFGLITIILLLALWSFPLYGAESEPSSEKDAGAGLNLEKTGEKNQYNDCAAFIAGISNPQSTLRAYEDKPAWIKYAKFINQGWESFAKKRLATMREWAARELGSAITLTVFYPFSGPDFVNVYTLFPGAKTYLMVALEPVGEIPDFAAIDEREFFATLQHSLYDLLHLDFFITAKMGASLGDGELTGVLPVLMVFLAREKARVLDIRYLAMQPDGTIAESTAVPPGNSAGVIPGVRIVFAGAGSAEKQTLYYFRVNLRNDSWSKIQPFVAFLKSFGPVTTFAKAASYLMYKPQFSAIRQVILDQSRYVLQTDESIPLKYFDPLVWNLRFYGTYKGPIPLFSKCQQPDLAKIYKCNQEIRPLPFGIGYHHRVTTSNLMLASRKPVVFAGGRD